MDKTRAVKLLDDTFRKNFEINQFSRFIKELFNEIQINIQDKTHYIANQFKEYIAECKKIAEYKDSSKKSMEILAVKLKRTPSRDRARTMQRNFISSWLSKQRIDAALVAFYSDDNEDWRFSYVKMEYNLVKNEDEKVIIEKESTPAKRYSFLVGINEPNHTCQRQFLDLVMEEKTNPSISEIEQAFSIEKVTKEFFEKYKELAINLKESMDKILQKDTRIKAEFDNKGLSTIDFSKKLLGQIVFIYFLQKKGWLGAQKKPDGTFDEWGTGPKNFLRKLFDKEIVPYDNFFNDMLEPLFYEALANDRSVDNDYYSRFKCKIPFLNGGLFEPLNDYDWTGTDIKIPNDLFSNSIKTQVGDIGTGILDVFDRYNFTVKEDEPLEKEVAVDPEMLGKVFENLLGVKERKDKGAFYTPREIVHYMCQQSLINYLETKTENVPREDIEQFIQFGDIALDLTVRSLAQKETYHGKSFVDEKLLIPKSISDNYQKIDKLLQDIKIVDPAVGSGAFPVGMMNEIVKARSILTLFFNTEEQKDRTEYNMKRQCIENCLYGVDIDSSAVEIAKLRFWLSLIVDEEDIKIIKPLPNLDHKIMCGNSLLEEFEGVKLFDEKLLIEIPKDYSYQLEQIDREVNKLNQELHDIYTGMIEDNGRTKQIQRDLKNLKKKKQEILSGPDEDVPQITLDEALQKRIRESQKRLKELKNLQKKFFNEQNRNKKRQLRENIDKIEWELIEETLKEQGNEDAMQKLEQYKKNKSKPFFLWKLYFSEVFQRENSGFDVVIGNPPYGFRNVLSKEEKLYFRKKRKIAFPSGDIAELFILFSLNQLVRDSGNLTFIIPKKSLYGESWRNVRQIWCSNNLTFLMDASKAFERVLLEQVSFSIIKKDYSDKLISLGFLNQKGDRIVIFGKFNLKEIFTKDLKNIQIYRGLCPVRLMKKIEKNSIPYTEKFIRAKIGISNITKCLTFEKDGNIPCIKGIDIIKYGLKKQKRYLKKEIAQRYVDQYKHEKIIAQKILAHVQNPYPHIIITLFYDDKGTLLNDTCVEIEVLDKLIDKKFLMTYLQSKFCNWYAYNFIYNRAIRTMDFINYYVVQMPIPKLIIDSSNKQSPFINLANQILSITKDDDYLDNPDKQAKVKRLENEIDELVYELYELTPEEIKIVEEFNKEK